MYLVYSLFHKQRRFVNFSKNFLFSALYWWEPEVRNNCLQLKMWKLRWIDLKLLEIYTCCQSYRQFIYIYIHVHCTYCQEDLLKICILEQWTYVYIKQRIKFKCLTGYFFYLFQSFIDPNDEGEIQIWLCN